MRDGVAKIVSELPDTVAEEAQRTGDVLLSLNKDQLLYGRDAKGNVLTPDYMTDPYFKSYASAARYQKYKEELEDNHWNRIRFQNEELFPDKAAGTPNLIINGNWFHNHLFIDVGKDEYTIGSTGIAAESIQKKYDGYGHPVFGLAPQSKKYYWGGFMRPAVWKLILKHIGKK